MVHEVFFLTGVTLGAEQNIHGVTAGDASLRTSYGGVFALCSLRIEEIQAESSRVFVKSSCEYVIYRSKQKKATI